MKKRKKPKVGTWYAVRLLYPRGTWMADGGHVAYSFKKAALFPTRTAAHDFKRFPDAEIEVVPVRVRVLTSKKRNAKRAR